MDGCGIESNALRSLFWVAVGEEGQWGEPVRTTVVLRNESAMNVGDGQDDFEAVSSESSEAEGDGGAGNNAKYLKEQCFFQN